MAIKPGTKRMKFPLTNEMKMTNETNEQNDMPMSFLPVASTQTKKME